MRLLIVLLVGCSYTPSFRDCDVACSNDMHCPTGFTCGPEGLCRTSGIAPSCDGILDARADIDAPPGTHYCAGAPTQCDVLVDNMTSCGTQMGCTWTATSCAFTENCSNHLPNTDCDGTGGCQTYVVQPYCRYISGYCSGSTKATCEGHTNCALQGGCSGVAKPCGQLSTQNACQAQLGCTWK